ncbi:MAG: alpha/beta hydrolase family protein [Ilumatobacteraceae bacterium]
MRKPFALALISTITLAVAACGGDDSGSDAPSTEAPSTEVPDTDAPSTEAPTTEAPTPEELAQAFVDPGPYPVGVTTLALEAGNQVEVWYPAVDGTTGTESYDVRDFVPEAIRTLLTADVPAVYEYAAGRDAVAADGSFPVVLFSHGYSGIRLQSTFLTSHLASWGMIVASPDHWSRDLYHVLSAPVGDRASSINELLASLDLVVGLNTTAGSILEGRVDDSRVVAVGHSAGGGTIVGAAKDDRVDGYISLASGVGMTADNTAADFSDVPNKPSFFIAGALDGVISAQERTKPSYEGVPEPSRLWIIDGVGHNGFDDFCTFGNGSGIIGVAMASGLGPLLEAQPQLKTLGEDGCLPPSVPVDETFPIIRHAVTAQLRYWFGDDVAPVGLGPDVAKAYSVAVEIAEKG